MAKKKAPTPETTIQPEQELPVALEKPLEAPTEAVEALVDDQATPASNEEENALAASTDQLDVMQDITSKEYTQQEVPLEQEMQQFTLSGVNLTTIIGDVLFAGSLGAGLVPKILPRLSSLPYQVRLQLPKEAYTEFLRGEGRVEWEDGVDYNKVAITSIAADKWIKDVLALGALDGVLEPKKVVRTAGRMLQVQVFTRKPVANSPTLSVYPKHVKYSKEELLQFNIYELKTIAGWYKISGRAKQQLIKDILEAQEK